MRPQDESKQIAISTVGSGLDRLMLFAFRMFRRITSDAQKMRTTFKAAHIN